MPERATLLQTTQIGVESTMGTSVAANKLLLGTSIEAGIRADVKTYRPYGQKFATVTALGKEWMEATISGPLTYTDWTYLMASGIAYAAPAQQAATAAYKWTASMAQAAEDTIKSYTVEIGSPTRAHKFTHGLVNNIGYTINRDEATIKGSMIGQRISDGITMTASPTAIALVPVVPTQVDVTLDATSGGLGTTKLTRVLSVDFETGDRYSPVWPVDSAQTSFATYTEKELSPMLKLKMEADAAGMARLTEMRNGTKAFIRVKGTGALIASTYYYTFQHDICGIVSDVSDFSDEDGLYAIEWTFTPVYDSGWAKSMEFQITNTLTAL
jgi:hypothetical protein